MANIKIPGITIESIEEAGRRMEEKKAILDRALNLVKTWPSTQPGSREQARWELGCIARRYEDEIEERNLGAVSEVAEELEELAECAAKLNDRLNKLSLGSRLLLQRFRTTAGEDLFREAGGPHLPSLSEGEISYWEDSCDVEGPGVWQIRTGRLADWARLKASKLRERTPRLGRKTLDDVLKGETSDLWLMGACDAWIQKFEWHPKHLRAIASLVHEAVTREKRGLEQAAKDWKKRGEKLPKK